MLNCEELNDALPLYVLDAVDEAVRRGVEQHLHCCPACRRAEAELHGFAGQIAAHGRQNASSHDLGRLQANLLQRCRRELRAASPPTRQFHTRRWAAAAAMLVLAAGCMAVLLSRPRSLITLEKSKTTTTGATFSEVWHADAVEVAAEPPTGDLVAGPRGIFLVRQDSHAGVVALDLATGHERWRWAASRCQHVAADEQRVYCVIPAHGGAELVALDATCGRPVWRRGADEALLPADCCHPIVLPEGNLAWVAGSSVRLLRAADGEVLWERQLAQAGTLLCATADNNNLYVAGERSLHCVDLKSGVEQWREELEERPSFATRPQIASAGGKVFVAWASRSNGSRLLCLDGQSHRKLWSRSTTPAVHLLAADGAILLRNQEVQAFDPSTGQPLWQRKATGCGPLTYSNGLIYFVDSGRSGALIALRASDGQPAAEIGGLKSCSVVMTVGQTGYLQTRDGVVRAIALARRS